MQQKPGPARRECEACLAAWKNAGGGLPLLAAARRESDAALATGRQ